MAATRADYVNALREFNAAAQHLREVWEQYNHGEAVGYPEFMPSFDDACIAFSEWTGCEEEQGE